MRLSLDEAWYVGTDLSPSFVGHLTVNYLDILSDISGKFSWSFAGCLTVNIIGIFFQFSIFKISNLVVFHLRLWMLTGRTGLLQVHIHYF